MAVEPVIYLRRLFAGVRAFSLLDRQAARFLFPRVGKEKMGGVSFRAKPEKLPQRLLAEIPIPRYYFFIHGYAITLRKELR